MSAKRLDAHAVVRAIRGLGHGVRPEQVISVQADPDHLSGTAVVLLAPAYRGRDKLRISVALTPDGSWAVTRTTYYAGDIRIGRGVQEEEIATIKTWYSDGAAGALGLPTEAQLSSIEADDVIGEGEERRFTIGASTTSDWPNDGNAVCVTVSSWTIKIVRHFDGALAVLETSSEGTASFYVGGE